MSAPCRPERAAVSDIALSGSSGLNPSTAFENAAMRLSLLCRRVVHAVNLSNSFPDLARKRWTSDCESWFPAVTNASHRERSVVTRLTAEAR